MLAPLCHFCSEHQLLEPLMAVMLGALLTASVHLLQESLFRPLARL